MWGVTVRVLNEAMVRVKIPCKVTKIPRSMGSPILPDSAAK